MRVMYIQPAEGFGGAERQGVLHISRLPRYGFEVVPVVGPGEPIRRALAVAGVRDYVFSRDLPAAATRPPSLVGRLGRGLGYLRSWHRATRTLEELARERHVDLIFASRPFAWSVAGVVGRHLGLPVIWRIGSRPTHWAQVAATRYLGRLFAPDLFVSNSVASRDIFEPLLGVAGVVMRNGVDTARFDPRRVAPRLRERLGLSPFAPVVGMAARPAPEKGLELLAAMTHLVARQVPDLRVLVAGEYAWRAHYEAMFRRHGLGERVTFLGHVDDVETFFRSVDVTVLTSPERSIEASSNAVLEAMAMARPVVVTPVGGLPEAVRHGVEGFLAPPDDPQRFAAHVTALLRDRGLRERMGAAGRATILRGFSDEAAMARLAALLELVATRHHRATATRGPAAAARLAA